MEQMIVGIAVCIMIFIPIIKMGVGAVILKKLLKFLGVTK